MIHIRLKVVLNITKHQLLKRQIRQKRMKNRPVIQRLGKSQIGNNYMEGQGMVQRLGFRRRYMIQWLRMNVMVYFQQEIQLVEKQKYNISSNLKAVDVFAFVAKDGWPTAVVINGTRYLNATANTLVYVGNDCVYINQSLLTIPEGQNTADYVITPEG